MPNHGLFIYRGTHIFHHFQPRTSKYTENSCIQETKPRLLPLEKTGYRRRWGSLALSKVLADFCFFCLAIKAKEYHLVVFIAHSAKQTVVFSLRFKCGIPKHFEVGHELGRWYQVVGWFNKFHWYLDALVIQQSPLSLLGPRDCWIRLYCSEHGEGVGKSHQTWGTWSPPFSASDWCYVSLQ